MDTVIPVDNRGVLAAVRDFLKLLVESGTVVSVFVPLETDGGEIVPALVADPVQLELANPLAPVMPINGSRAVSAITGGNFSPKIGGNSEKENVPLCLVLRPCEIRALVELVKLNQIRMEKIVLVGIDCLGTYEVRDYLEYQRNGNFSLSEYLATTSQGDPFSIQNTDLELRLACQMCTQPIPEHTAIHLHLFGVDTTHGIPVTIKDEIAVELGLTPNLESDFSDQRMAIDRLINSRNELRRKEQASIRAQLSADGGMPALFAACIRCHNCMTVCPICYCKTCLFKTTAFHHDPDHYLRAARHKGAVRLLGDTLLFHISRLNHMSVSCVGCGMCTSACPANIPVGTIFSTVGEQVQAAFDYMPGRSLDEPLPLITFQTDEWMEVGESG